MRDRLIEIPTDQLAQLKDLLHANFPQHLVGYGLIANLCDWYAETPRVEHLQVLSLNGEWSQDGLLLVTDRCDLFIYSTVENNPRLRTALKLLDWKRAWRICSLDSRNHSDVLTVLKELKVHWDYHLPFDTLYCPQSAALAIQFTVPEDVLLRRLQPAETEAVNNLWTYRHPGSEVGVRRLIERNYCVGAYDKATGQLMGWCLTFISQCHNALQVEPEFMGRGLGKLIVAKLAYERALRGKFSHAFVSATNHVSQKIFKSLGFVRLGEVFWIGTKPLEPFQCSSCVPCFS